MKKSPVCTKLDPDKIVVQRHLAISAVVAVELVLPAHPLLLVPPALGVNRHGTELTADKASTAATVETPVDVDHLSMICPLLLNPPWPPVLVTHNVRLGYLDGAGRDTGVPIMIAGWAPQAGGQLARKPHHRIFGIVTGASVTCVRWTDQW